MTFVGTFIVIGHAINDIMKVKSALEDHNDELIYQKQFSVTLMPGYFANSGAAGVQLQLAS